MDYVTRQFIVWSNKLVAELRQIRQHLASLQEQVGAIRDSAETANEQAQRPQTPLPSKFHAELQVPESVQREQRAQNKYHNRIQTATALGTLGAFIAAAIYAGVAAFQLEQMKIAANAAKDAAQTAKDSVHLSERAYITLGSPQLDLAKKIITVAVTNSGRIPAGAANVVLHGVIAKLPTPFAETYNVPGSAIEKGWQHHAFDSIEPGTPHSIIVPLHMMDKGAIEKGQQVDIVVGFVSYNDGFPDTPTQRWNFCVNTVYHFTLKQVFLTNCDPNMFLPAAELADGYPNNESR